MSINRICWFGILFFKQKTAYEMRISDWSSDVCSSDLSKEVAYGNNRADFSFIAGGVVPGALIIKPDFPENHEDWSFFWGENEYVVPEASPFIELANAANDLAGRYPVSCRFFWRDPAIRRASPRGVKRMAPAISSLVIYGTATAQSPSSALRQ